MDVASGIIYSVAGNGATPSVNGYTVGQTGGATSLAIGGVTGVAVDPTGQMYFAKSDVNFYGVPDQVLYKVTAPGGLVFPTETLVNTPDTTDDPALLVLGNDGASTALTLTAPSAGTNPSITAGF